MSRAPTSGVPLGGHEARMGYAPTLAPIAADNRARRARRGGAAACPFPGPDFVHCGLGALPRKPRPDSGAQTGIPALAHEA